MINDMNTPLDPFVYNNSYYPTDLAASQYYYQSGGSSGNAEQVQQIIMMYSELKGVDPEEIVEGLKSLSEEEASQQLQLMLEEIEDAEYQQQIEQSRKASEEQDVDYDVEEEEEVGMPYGYDPEEFIERQEMILQNQQQEANDRIAEEEEAEPEPTEAQSYLTDPYKYGGAKKRFISKLKKAMGGMDVVKMPQADFNKNNYGENMLGSFVQGVQNNSKKALINEAAQNVEKTISQNPEMLLAPMAQFGMQMYNPMSTLSANAGAGMDYINSRMPSNQAMMDSFGNAYNQFLNDTGINQAANDQQQTVRYGGDLPKAQSLGNFDPKMFKPSPVTGKYSWEGNSRNSLLNNPNIPRVPVIKAAPKKEVGNHWYKNKQAPDSFLENILELVDPIGFMSYDDAARADSSFKASGRKYPTFDESLDIIGALPALGKIKYLKAANGLKKSISYGYFPLQQLINAFDSSKDIIDDNLGDVDIKTVPSRVYPYRQGGSLPTAQKGKEYARKLWEQQYGKDIPEAQQQQLFDEFYSRMKPQVWNDVASQMSNFQSAGNMFNYVPGLGQNPWGYRSFNNPFLQQYAYNPRWYAQKPGSNKKINIRNLPDWSDADLIKTEQMTNRRGRPTGYRYTLQKPSSVIRTEQPAADPNYVVPKVSDVMLNPATQSSVVNSTNNSNISTPKPVTITSENKTTKRPNQDISQPSKTLPDLNQTINTPDGTDQATALEAFRLTWYDHLKDKVKGSDFLIKDPGYIAPWEIGPYTKEQDLIEKKALNMLGTEYNLGRQDDFLDARDVNTRGFTKFREDFLKLPAKNNSDGDLEISDEKRKKFDQTIQNAPEGTTIEIVKPKQYGGPFLVPYSNEYMAQQYADYKNFYDDYTRPPSNRTMGDGYDEYDSYMRRNIKKNPIYASGWLEESKDGKLKIFYDEADNNTEPQPSSKYNVRRVDNEIVGYQNDPVESNMISDMSHAMAWQNAADRRKNRFPQNMYPGFLKSQQKGGQLYLYRNGGLPKFQGPEASELTALKPRTYPDPFKAGVMEYPEETLDVVQTTKPNFLQGVVRAMPYMNFANNMYDRISAENQRNKLRQQATSIEGIASPISDYKGRFSEYGAYQPNLQGFQGMGSARFGGNITDGEYYLSDSEIQDIINMGGEVEFLED